MLLFIFIPLVLLAGRRQRGVVLLIAGHALLTVALWFLFTQQIARFLEVAFPLAAGWALWESARPCNRAGQAAFSRC